MGGELQNIITLLEGLLETSEGQEQALADKVSAETQAALESAEVLTNAASAVEDAQAALALREQEHQAASDAHDDQEDKKTAAEQEFADLSVGLDSEQEVIRQVIAMLQGLQPQQPCDGCVELDGRPFATWIFVRQRPHTMIRHVTPVRGTTYLYPTVGK